MVLPIVISPFPPFSKQNESSVQTYKKPMYALLGFEKWQKRNQPLRQPCETYVEKFRIGTTSKGSDIQHLSIQMICSDDQVMRVASHWEKILHLQWQTTIY